MSTVTADSHPAEAFAAALVAKFPDLQPIAHFFGDAVRETWDQRTDPGWLSGVWAHVRALMESQQARMFRLLNNRECCEVLVESMAAAIYHRVRACAGLADGEQPRDYIAPWRECAAEHGVQPENLEPWQYVSWASKKGKA